MRIAVAQIDVQVGGFDQNMSALIQAIRRAAEQGCDVVVFPEMSDLGYHMPTIQAMARPWSEGGAGVIAEAAAASRIAVVAGFAERDGEAVFNTLAVVDSTGRELCKYRKVHLITHAEILEQNTITPGSELVLCTFQGFRFGFMTCYDIRFPEMARALALKGADCLVVSAAFPRARIEHWKAILTCRAIENQAYLAASNQVCDSSGIQLGGCSTIIDPFGNAIASAPDDRAAMVVAEASRSRITAVRQQMQVFADRQPALYKAWE